MSSYIDADKWLRAGHLSRRMHYVWGPEYSLIEDLVDRYRTREAVGEAVGITATGKNDGAVWAMLNQYPAQPVKLVKVTAEDGTVRERPLKRVRHVTVRNAHLIGNFKPLESWQRTMRSVTALLVGDDRFDTTVRGRARCPRGHAMEEDNLVTVVRYGREAQYCRECRRVRAFLMRSGRLVECGQPRTKKQREQFIETVARLANSGNGRAMELLRSCEWSVGAVMEVLKKIGLRDQPLTDITIRENVLRSYGGDYLEALRRTDRAKAAAIAPYVDPDCVPRLLIDAERWLGLVQRSISAVRSGRSTQEIVTMLNISWFEAEMVCKGAGRYTNASATRAVEALGAADIAWHRDYARTGVLEVLALSW